MKQHIDVGIGTLLHAVGPLKVIDECRIPGLPLGWTHPGGDPAGLSNNKVLATAKIVTV